MCLEIHCKEMLEGKTLRFITPCNNNKAAAFSKYVYEISSISWLQVAAKYKDCSQ